MHYLRLNLIIIAVLIQISAFSEPVNYITSKQAANNKIVELNKSNQFSIVDFKHAYSDEMGQELFYIFEISPQGYIVVSADTDLPPVIAYSFNNNYDVEAWDDNPLIKILLSDIKLRIENISNLPDEIILQRNNAWQNVLDKETDNTSSVLFQQWPPEGTTSTGGWLETNWTQNAPYNNFCPMDPVTGSRSIAGCPAVAMAMIVNYYETINGTFFTDSDDYHHSYAGRDYWIDDDYEEQDFPSFPVLNAYLDTLVNCYVNQTALKASEKAAITFACGVAATQVYTSSGSGTFGVSQAFDAYMKFGFQEAILMNDNDTSFYTKLSQNMMDARPVHLAVVDPPVSMGHNVVTDGYNTDNYYHLNFGWGGSYNGWYLLPDEIPYGLTVIEGAILNIAFPPVNTSTPENKLKNFNFSLKVSPNPATDKMNIEFTLDKKAQVKIDIFDLKGELISTIIDENVNSGTYSINWNVSDSKGNKLSKGLFICKLYIDDQNTIQKFVIR